MQKKSVHFNLNDEPVVIPDSRHHQRKTTTTTMNNESSNDDGGVNRRAMLRSQLSMMPKSRGERTNYQIKKAVGLTGGGRNADIPSNSGENSSKATAKASGPSHAAMGSGITMDTMSTNFAVIGSKSMSSHPIFDKSSFDSNPVVRTKSSTLFGGGRTSTKNLDGGGGGNSMNPSGGGILSNTDNRSKSNRYIQVRFESTKVEGRSKNSIWYYLGLGDTKISIYESSTDDDETLLFCGISANRLITNFFNWVFRKSFMTFLLVSCLSYLTISFLFAGMIYGIGLEYPHCIGGVEFVDEDLYVDAFLLSWTTFATLGYGMIYPAVSSADFDARDCTGITIVLAYEAFCGLLFGSICSAILFIKVSRVQSFAQIVFSDPLLIRYGSGVNVDHYEETKKNRIVDLWGTSVNNKGGKGNTSNGAAVGGVSQQEQIQCPVLEFRIVNRLNNVRGGEITDCSANLVASIDVSQAAGLAGAVANAQRRKKRSGKKRSVSTNTSSASPAPSSTQSYIQTTAEKAEMNAKEVADLNKIALQQLGITAPKRVKNNATTKKVFARVETESSEHPYFKRVWLIRHVLNAESPLLNNYARGMVQRNNGYWPSELNNPTGIRAAIQFDTLVVSFSGLSNADGNSVYAQHIYDYGDISVGYSFCNMLYRDADDDSLFVDISLLNVVMEQHGGGGEPLDDAIPKIGNTKDKFRSITL